MTGFDTYTKRARRVIDLAQDEARGFGHDYLGTEHLLLGLIREGEGAAARALAALGVDEAEVRAAIASIIGRGEAAAGGELPLTPRTKRALEQAAAEARHFDRRFIGTEHLLLGMLRDGESAGSETLAGLGVTSAQVLDQLAPMLQARPGGLREAVEVAGGRMRARKRGGDEADAPKGNVITCRVTDHDLAAIDALVEAGIRTTRSDAAAWLIGAGIGAHGDLFAQIHTTIEQIRRLRADAQAIMRQAEAAAPPPSPGATEQG